MGTSVLISGKSPGHARHRIEGCSVTGPLEPVVFIFYAISRDVDRNYGAIGSRCRCKLASGECSSYGMPSAFFIADTRLIPRVSSFENDKGTRLGSIAGWKPREAMSMQWNRKLRACFGRSSTLRSNSPVASRYRLRVTMGYCYLILQLGNI